MGKTTTGILIGIVAPVIVGALLLSNSNNSSQDTPINPSNESHSQIQIEAPTVTGKFTVGQPAPEVTFTDFEGNPHLLSDFSGQAVILDFWAGWCPFCVAEMPELESASKAFGDDLAIIGIHRTDTEDPVEGLAFAKERGVTYLLVSDDGSLYRASNGFGMPVAIFIDKEGIVTEIKSGPKTAEEIRAKVLALLQ